MRGATMNAAINHRNVDKIKAIIALDPTVVNDLGPGGHSPLVSAEVNGDKDIAALLLAAGADPNKPNGQGSLPLTAAIGTGQPDLVTDAPGQRGRRQCQGLIGGVPPLFAAISQDNLEIVKKLADKGAKLTTRDSNGQTAVMAAMSAQGAGAGDIVQYLLSQGATLPEGGTNGRALVNSALNSYTSAQMLPIVLAQIKDINNAPGSDGLSILHKAVERGRRRRSAAGAGTRHPGGRPRRRRRDAAAARRPGGAIGPWCSSCWTTGPTRTPATARARMPWPCCCAGRTSPLETRTATLARSAGRRGATERRSWPVFSSTTGRRSDVPDRFGLIPVQYTLLNHDKLAFTLLPKRADTPFLRLLLAIAAGNAAQATALLKASPDLSHARLSTGTTALHVAAIWGAVAPAAALIRAGADVNARDAYARTPLALAAGEGGGAAMAKFLLVHGADVEASDCRDATPLHQAVMAQDPAAVAALLAVKADVNARSRAIGPPLAYAAGDTGSGNRRRAPGRRRGPERHLGRPAAAAAGRRRVNDLPLVRLLIAHGSDLNAHGPEPCTPLMAAIQRRFDEIARLLIASGADVGATVNGQSALGIANSMGASSLADLIKSKLSAADVTKNDHTRTAVTAAKPGQMSSWV